jgi:hypothetical protein
MEQLNKRYPILNELHIDFTFKDIPNQDGQIVYGEVPVLVSDSQYFTININSNILNYTYRLKYKYRTKYGASKNCKINALIIHEVGHIIDFCIWQQNLQYREYRDKLFENKNAIKTHLSTRALYAPRECMAEAFIKHFYYPKNSFIKQLSKYAC